MNTCYTSHFFILFLIFDFLSKQFHQESGKYIRRLQQLQKHKLSEQNHNLIREKLTDCFFFACDVESITVFFFSHSVFLVICMIHFIEMFNLVKLLNCLAGHELMGFVTFAMIAIKLLFIDLFDIN